MGHTNVLLIHGTDEWYGSDRALYTLATHLREAGLVVRVVLVVDKEAPPGPLRTRLRTAGFSVETASGSLLSRAALAHPGKALRTNVRGAVSIARIARRHRAVVVANTSLVAHLGILARVVGQPAITYFREMPNSPRIARFITRWIYAPISTLTVSISYAVRDFNVPEWVQHKALVITDAIVVEDGATQRPPPRPHPDRQRVVVLGRLNPLRAPHLALDAMERLLKRGFDVELRFIGNQDSPVHADYADELRGRAERPPLYGRVFFDGFIAQPDLFILDADIVLNPRPEEPLGHVVFEAFRLSTPVVASRAGGPMEHIRHGETGLLFTPGDPLAMADAVARVLSSEDERIRIGEAAHATYLQLDDRIAIEHRELAARIERL